MKKSLKVLLSLAVVLLLGSCKKEGYKVVFEGGTSPVLSTNTTNIPLAFATQSDPAFTLRWTNPEYKFNTGANSIDVNYNILVDKSSSFNSPDIKTLSIGTAVEKIFTQSEFNDILLNQLQLSTGVQTTVYIKLQAFLVGGAGLLTSNTLTVTATPYAIPPKITPPASGNLYIVGDATPGGWPPVSVDESTLKFNQVSATMFELTLQLNANKEYKFVEVIGQWDKQWSVKEEPDAGSPGTLSGDLYFNGANGRAPAESGLYKIVVDFQRGKYSFTKQ
ncbi:MAG: SusE domain-containing protein [Chitinophagaceae bacterium]|nr:SusE domain-containing protein [Chitinophagaceae bacterium]MCW5915129.1 SusE domain-containing protein [Chitinophagaceae bacterium]MCZ2396532.1 SusE domain-containing protein [Chitinophagales bacterium]